MTEKLVCFDILQMFVPQKQPKCLVSRQAALQLFLVHVVFDDLVDFAIGARSKWSLFRHLTLFA